MRPNITKGLSITSDDLFSKDNIVNEFKPSASIRFKDEPTSKDVFDKSDIIGRVVEEEEIKDKTRENFPILEGNEYPTEVEKKERINEIDLTINKLKEKQQKIATQEEERNPYSESFFNMLSDVKDDIGKKINIKGISKQIKILSNEKEILSNEIKPISEQEIKDIEEAGYGIYADFNVDSKEKFEQLESKYTPERLNKVYKKSIDDKYNEEIKQRLQFKTPENILSYNNIINGTIPELNKSYAEKTDLNNILYKASLDPEYKTAMYDKKRKIIAKQVDNYISTKENIEDKKLAKENILSNILPLFVNQNDNLTIEGAKLHAEYMLEKINTIRQYHESILQQAKSKYNLNSYEQDPGLVLDNPSIPQDLTTKTGIGNGDKWFEKIAREQETLNQAADFWEKILKTPEAKNGIKDMGKGYKSLTIDEFLLGIPELQDALQNSSIAKKAIKGEDLTYGEESIMQGLASLNYAKSLDTENGWFKTARGTALMIPYILEYVYTGGMYTVGKKATLKYTTKTLEKTVGKKIGDYTAKQLGRVIGTGAQTIALPQIWLKNTAENMTPDIVVDPQLNDIKYKILENTGDDAGKAFAKGFTSAYAEIFFERAGKFLTLKSGIPAATKGINNLAGKEIVTTKFLDDFMKIKGIKSITSLTDKVVNEKLGWHGVFEEYMEELGSYVVDKKVQGENVFIGNENFWEDQLVTLGTVAMFGGVMSGVSRTSKLIGDNKIFTQTTKDGKEKQTVVPSKMYNEFIKVMEERDPEDKSFLNGDKFQEFMDKHEKKMTPDQVELFMSLGIQKGIEQEEQNISNTFGEQPKDILPTDITEQDNPELTDEEKKTINEENEKIRQKYPELSSNNLLLRSKTGQLIEPNDRSLKYLHRQLTHNVSLLERDEKGDFKNLTPEDETKVTQLEIINAEIDKISDKDTPFEELTVEKKQERLLSELKEGKELKAEVKFIAEPGYKKSGTGMTLKLEDGRTIKAYINPTFSEEKKQEIRATLKGDNKNVQLVHDSYENWNEWDEEKEDYKYTGPNGIPYWDAIRVSYNGEVIGSVEVTDFRKKNIVEEKKEKIEEEITKGIDDIFSSFTVEKPIEETEDNSIKNNPKQHNNLKIKKEKIISKKEYNYPVKPLLDKRGLLAETNDYVDLNLIEKAYKNAFNVYPGGERFTADGKKENGKTLIRRDQVRHVLSGFYNDNVGWLGTKDELWNKVLNELKKLEIKNDEKNTLSSGISEMSQGISHINTFHSKQEAIDYYNNPKLAENKEFRNYLLNLLQQNNLQLNIDYSYQEIQKIIPDVKNSIFNFINKQFSETFNKLNTKVRFIEQTETGAAKYLSYQDAIIIPLNNICRVYAAHKLNRYKNNIAFTPEVWLKKVFVHESNHAYTALKILAADNRNDDLDQILPILTTEEFEAIDNLKRLYDYVKTKLPESTEYGLENIQEFIAEAFSNSSFIKLLSSIEVSEKDFKTDNAFVAFVKYILELLGIKKSYNSAYDAIVNIANVLAKNYDSQEVKRFTEDYEVLSSLINVDEISYELNQDTGIPDDMSLLLNKFLDYLNNIDWVDMPVKEIIYRVNNSIVNSKLSDEKKGWLKAFVFNNKEKIIDRITKKILENKGYKVKSEELKINDVIIPNFEGVTASGEEKVRMMLNSFGKLWRSISDKTGSTRENIERNFFLIAKNPDINEYLRNEESFHEYLDSYETDDLSTKEIINSLRNASFKSIISLFDFYSNLYLTKQYGLFYNKGFFSLKLLNPSQKYDDFVDSLKNTIQSFKFQDYQGYKALKFAIQDHTGKRNERFKSNNNKDWTYYDSLSKEEREKLRREQHESDVQFLSSITGITPSLWRQYFNQQTRETFAYASKEAENESNYITYDNLLSNDTWRKGKNMMYRRIQSDIAFQLWQQTVNNPNISFEVAFDNFFLKGNEDVGVMSNLYKLSTSIQEKNEIGMSGYDVKHDRFSSFIQSSNVTTQADNILSSNLINNHVVQYYKSKGQPMDIIYLNGLKDISESNKDGIEDINLSGEDLWVAQLDLFFKEGSSYLHWLGQFGDKPQLLFVDAPKLELTEKNIEDIKKIFPDFENAAEWIQKYIDKNQDKFTQLYKNSKEDYEIISKNAARLFTYNFAKNIQATNELFFGKEESYDNDLTKMVKRGGSSISPGYLLNSDVEGGVGKTYRFACVIDKYSGLKDIFDGCEFTTGEYAKRTQVSMGSIFNKEDIDEFKTLDSIKCLFSTIDPVTGLRGLTKGNRINIDILADTFPGSKYDDIRKIMKDKEIDVLSFNSTTKIHEKSGTNVESQSITLWNKDGKVLKKPIIPEFGIVNRNTSDVYVQQDLRHSAIPKTSKMSSQTLSNILMLDNGPKISNLLYDLQQSIISEMTRELDKAPLDKSKMKWIEENVKENNQEELIRLLKLGMSPYEPAYNNYIKKMFAGILTKKALEIPINRVVTQEIPDPENLLQGRRLTSDGKYILLPDIAANIEGARYEDDRFKGKPDEAIAFIKTNKGLYRDLLDENYEVKEWEIRERNGIIPGELVIVTRTPADDLHSHTVGRLKVRIKGGNFCMLDAVSRAASGSDFDGDQRFIQTFYKDKDGKIINDNSKEGIANQIMLLMAEDYSNPKFNQKISNAINTKFIDDIVDEYRKDIPKYSFLDPRGYAKARDENMVGVKMKGMITDMVTVYSLLAGKKIPFKTNISIQIGEKEVELSKMDQERISELKDSNTYEEFEKLFLNQEVYLNNISIPLGNKERQAARLNLIAGKKTKQAEILQNTIKYFYETGDIELVLGSGINTSYHHQSIENFIKENKQKQTTKVPETINLTGISADPNGYIKNALVNFLNLCFDNAKDPKIEIVGFNEITAPMFVLYLIGDETLSDASEKEIKEHIYKETKYFTSPLLKRFTEYMRSKNGALRDISMETIKNDLYAEFTKDDVDKLFKFYYQSQDLRKIRNFYSLTQTAPSTITDYYVAEDLYNTIKNNKLKFIDTKNLFEKDGSPISEFKISRKVLDMARDYIFKDSFEESTVGKQIIDRIKKSFEKDHQFTKEELSSISYGINTIAVLRALNIKIPAKQLESELIENLNKYRTENPNNLFFLTIQKILRKGKFHLEIDSNYRHQKINDSRLKDIKKNFDEIFEEDDQLAMKFATHIIMNWGASTTTARGSFYSLLGDEFRVFMSEIMYNELYIWQNDELSAMDKLDIMEMILRGSNIPGLKEKAFFKKKYSYYDIHKETTLRTDYSNEMLEKMDSLNSKSEFDEYVSQTNMNALQFQTDMENLFDKTMTSVIKDYKPAIKTLLSYRKVASKLFPADKSTDYTVKDMLESDDLGELLSSEDEAVSRFVYQWLQKKYPTVEIFKDREAFYEFVKKWGDKGFNINTEAIGHAFANAAYIDPLKAVQSTLFHEHTHIYWDALSNNDMAKKRILTMFKKAYPNLYEDDLEERIVLDIAHASVNFSMIQFKGNALQKFLELLKHFWRNVKIAFGQYKRMDIVQEMMYDVWYNSEKIVPRTVAGEHQIKNMVTYNTSEEDILHFDAGTHTYFIGKTPVPSPTIIIGTFKHQFNTTSQAKISAAKEAKMYKNLTKRDLTKKDIEDSDKELVKLWSEILPDRGTVIHSVGEDVFGGKKFDKSNLDKFAEGMYKKTRQVFEELKNDILSLYPQATFITEKQLISKKYMLGGTADLIVDLSNGDIIIYDYKTTAKQFADEEGKSLPEYTQAKGTYKAPFSNLADSKYNQHTLQLNMYANMIEEQQNASIPGEKNIVKKLYIIPILTEIKDGKVVSVEMGNHVPIRRNDKTIEASKQMMQISHAQRENVNAMLPKYRKNLLANKTPGYLVDSMMKAYHFFHVFTGGIENISKKHISDIRHAGIETMTNNLLTSEDSGGLGFSLKDLSGKSDFKAEELFYCAYHAIEKSRYVGYERLTTEEEKKKGEGETKKYLPEREARFIKYKVYEQYVPKENPLKKADEAKRHRKWSRFGKTLLQEISIDKLKEGDQIMAYYELEGKPDTPHIYYYTVIGVDLKRNKIKVIDQATNEMKQESVEIDPPGWKNRDGILRIEEKLPDLITEPGDNSFIPSYIYIAKAKEENHWKLPTKEGKDKQEQSIIDNNIRKVWAFFNNFSTWDELVSYCEEEKNVNELFTKVNTIDNEVAVPLVSLAREESSNHLFTEMIKREYTEHIDSPKYIMPQMLNLYYMLTGDKKNVVWKDFDTNISVRHYMNARMMSNHFVPLNLFNREVSTQRRQYIYDSIQMSDKLKKYIGKINFELIVNHNKETGLKTWVFPESVDTKINPLEKEFLTIIYEYYEKYDPDYRDSSNMGIVKQIPVASIYATRTEFIERYGKYGAAMYKKMAPQPFDNIKLRIVESFHEDKNPKYKKDENGNEIVLTLRQIKDLFAITEDPIEMQKMLGNRWQQFMHIPGTKYNIGNISAGMLNYYMKKAMRIYDKGGDELNEKENVEKAKKRMPVLGKSNIKYSTEKYVEATEKVIDSMLFAHHMKRLMGPLEWIYQQYTEGEDISEGGPAKSIASWIRVWGDYQLYGKKPLDHGFLSSRTMSDVIDAANKLNSWNKIAFALKTDFNNLLVGQAMDMIHEPIAYGTGVARIFEDPSKIIYNLRKARSLAKKFGLANIVDDAAFDMLDKEFRVFGYDIKKLENAGYAPMEIAEKLNQMPLFIGLMSREEWEAYNDYGEIIASKNKNRLSEYRKGAIINRIFSVQGDYGTENAAPGWITNQGKLIMTFKKWVPSMIMLHFGKYQLDTDYMVRSGIFPSLILAAKIISYNHNRTQKKQDETLRKLEEMYKDKKFDDVFFSGVNEYFTLLQKEVNGGRIKWKNLSENDQRKMVAGIIEATILVVGLLSMLGMFGDDDDKIYKPFYKRMFKVFFTRFRGDLMFVYDSNNWEYMLKNPIPTISLLTGSIQFVSDLIQWKKYTQDEMIAKKGTPKFLISATNFLPVGSFIRQIQTRKRIFTLKHKYYDLRELNFSDEKIKELGFDDYKISKFDLIEQSYKWKRMYRDLMLAQKYYSLTESGYIPGDIIDMEFGIKLKENEIDEMQEALQMITLQQMIDSGEIGLTEEQIIHGATEMRKLEEKRKSRSDRKTEKEFEKAQEKLKN
jgi:hypothetical protein